MMTTMFIGYLFTGALAGLLSGLIGIGGGLIVVPLLVMIFKDINVPRDMLMHFAAGTSLAVMMVTTSSSLRTHMSHGNKVWPIFKTLMPGIMVGTICGALISDYFVSTTLEVFLGLLLLVVSYRAFFAKKLEAGEKLPPTWVSYLVGAAIGTLSGLLGIGGGMLLAPYLMYCNVTIRLAVALSAACGLLVSIIGTLSYIFTGANEIHHLQWTTGFIYWPAFAGIALTSPIFAYIGARFSNKLSIDMLQKIFAVLMFIVAIKMLAF